MYRYICLRKSCLRRLKVGGNRRRLMMTKALESSVGAAGETRAGGRDRGRRDVSTFPSPVYVPDTSSGRSPGNLSRDLSLAQLLVLPTRGEAGNLLLASLGADRHDTADGPGGAAGADPAHGRRADEVRGGKSGRGHLCVAFGEGTGCKPGGNWAGGRTPPVLFSRQDNPIGTFWLVTSDRRFLELI